MSLVKEPVVLNMLFIFCFLMTSEIKMVSWYFQTKIQVGSLFIPNDPTNQAREPPKKNLPFQLGGDHHRNSSPG